MAVGASFADLAVILVDAKQGVLIQTKRHARICALMGIKHFVFAVNKMDLVGYSEERFNEINAQIAELTKELSLADVVVIPVSATEGDNVTTKSENIPWYKGQALLPYLEQVDVDDTEEEKGFYMPVQRVCRPDRTFRGLQEVYLLVTRLSLFQLRSMFMLRASMLVIRKPRAHLSDSRLLSS